MCKVSLKQIKPPHLSTFLTLLMYQDPTCENNQCLWPHLTPLTLLFYTHSLGGFVGSALFEYQSE